MASSAADGSPIVGQKRKQVGGNHIDGALDNAFAANNTEPQTVVLSSVVGDITIPVPVTYNKKQIDGEKVRKSLTVTGLHMFWQTTRTSRVLQVCWECAKQGHIIPLKNNSCSACEAAYLASQVMQAPKGTAVTNTRDLELSHMVTSSPLIYTPRAEAKECTSNKVAPPVQEQVVINGKTYPVTETHS
jgi:hypothetical protein